jgi:hypothetical protein
MLSGRATVTVHRVRLTKTSLLILQHTQTGEQERMSAAKKRRGDTSLSGQRKDSLARSYFGVADLSAQELVPTRSHWALGGAHRTDVHALRDGHMAAERSGRQLALRLGRPRRH